MSYFDKYIKYKIKYLHLLDMMNGGMSNFNINDELVSQIERKDINGNIYLENIDLEKYIEEIKNYESSKKIIILESEIIDLYNLLNIKEKYKFDEVKNKIRSDKIKKILKMYIKEYDKTVKHKKLIELQNIGIIINESSFYNKVNKEANRTFNNLNKQIQDTKLLNIKNGLSPDELKYYDNMSDIKKQIYLIKKYIDFERGNLSEDLIVKNSIVLQSFSGDFSEIKQSRNIKSYSEDISNIIRNETGLNDDELELILQYFPLDGISKKTLYEFKSFTKKDIYSNSEFNKTKLYGYELYKIKINNKTFNGIISYKFRYKNYITEKDYKIKIENIIMNMKGDIKDIHGKIIKKVNINNLKILPLNLDGYDYIWVELNNNGTFMKNALDKKYFTDNILIDNKKLLSDIITITGIKYEDIKNMSQDDFINKLLQIRHINIISYIEHYITELFEGKYILESDFDIILKNIEKYINSSYNIPEKYKYLFDRFTEPNFLFEKEKILIKNLIIIQNEILNNNYKLKSKYENNDKILNYMEDYIIYPTTQIEYMTKNIENGGKYTINNHINRQYKI